MCCTSAPHNQHYCVRESQSPTRIRDCSIKPFPNGTPAPTLINYDLYLSKFCTLFCLTFYFRLFRFFSYAFLISYTHLHLKLSPHLKYELLVLNKASLKIIISRSKMTWADPELARVNVLYPMSLLCGSYKYITII